MITLDDINKARGAASEIEDILFELDRIQNHVHEDERYTFGVSEVGSLNILRDLLLQLAGRTESLLLENIDRY